MSKLYFRYGAMNCGKSTNLLQVAYNYEERGMKVVLIKAHTDTKGEDKIVSRLGFSRKVDILVDKSDDIRYIIKKRNNKRGNIDCILVDEVQFLKKEHIDQLFKIAVLDDIPVICYGIRTDFQMNGFEGSERLLLLAHSLEELKTICKCGRKAIFNGRKVNGKFVFEGRQIAIDKKDNIEYESLCGKCYFKYKSQNGVI
ncbi:MAG: thymidine kinase [Clostridium sp.]|jgi:thymidine kinase|uniref:thymidine kinase n=1 Tax=Clostridium sp. TaxID=1506 RepID=UPI0025BDD357|nr:thymidine kinase [Clostridium sp.]MCH3965307.1 thymidine kinase [Clostridium sp.]MCI1714528.1 thymidine kinase [Clostridium sp.]MCI1798790.1 thymidine kinase [Clostridium sp.]MCI1812479.1 thymidine kinase [Clostridium sp.]MCI1869600.1 thymidine kinase [Clostridium sp.]